MEKMIFDELNEEWDCPTDKYGYHFSQWMYFLKKINKFAQEQQEKYLFWNNPEEFKNPKNIPKEEKAREGFYHLCDSLQHMKQITDELLEDIKMDEKYFK